MRLLLQRLETIVGDLRNQPKPESKDTAETLPQDQPLPHHVFLLDGPRGGGKSYTLTTIEVILRALSNNGGSKEFDVAKWLIHAGVATGPNGVFDESRRAAVHVLRVIFPGDMEQGDSLMEAVLAGVRDSLESRKNDYAPEDSRERDGLRTRETPPLRSEHGRRLSKLTDLLRELREEIAQGWYYAHQFGLDAIIRDSVDYGDLVTKFEKESGKAAKRAVAWRKFVHKYLDTIGAETLVVMLDDSDVGPELTADILHSTRMFLSHPRIVTVMAGNLDSMRGSLIQGAMHRLSDAIGSLGSGPENRTARDWRRGHRQLVEEYLDKVLPPANRLYLKPQQMPGDFERVAGKPFDKYVEAGFGAYRKPFLNAKFRLALGREISERDVPTHDEERKLESYLSWWFFADRYRNYLAPRTPRQIATFRDFYHDLEEVAARGGAESTGIRMGAQPKRLVVALFQNPANYLLVQRLADSDDSIPDWLRQQILESFWHGRRLFKINGRELEENGYTHRYLRYRLDVGLGLPIRDNVQAAVPNSLLPRPAGRQLMRRFLQAREMPRRPRSLGLSRWIDHAAIPANCLYFHDLESLPDITFLDTSVLKHEDIEKNQAGEWESFLSSRIYEVIDDRRGAVNVGESHDSVNSDDQQRALKDEYVFRYVREIVCESLRFSNEVKSATLMAELDPPDIVQKQTKAIYEHFIRDELTSFALNADIRCDGWWNAFGKDLREETNWRAREIRRVPEEAEERKLVERDWNSLQDMVSTIRQHLGPEQQRALDEVLTSLPKRFDVLAPAKEALLQPGAAHSDIRASGNRPGSDNRRAVALYCCLFTDLRRAWHAVRIHEAAPSVQPDDDESVTHASLSALTNRDRMPLYTRRQIRALLERSKWTKSVLNVFSQSAVHDVIGATFQKQALGKERKKNFRDEDLRSIFTASASDIRIAPRESSSANSLRKAQQLDEKADFQRWTGTLRNIGRTVCDDWPVHDLEYDGEEPARLESNIFGGEEPAGAKGIAEHRPNRAAERIHIFRDYINRGGDDQREERRKTQRSNARQARKLVWLLHGLAPSFPAIIHSEIMGMIYQVRLLEEAAGNYRFVDDAKTELQKTADALKSDANTEITAWADLIGTLSVVLRYIKIKALHLDVSFILREALHCLDTDESATTEIGGLLKVCGYERLYADGRFDIRRTVVDLIRAFEGVAPGSAVADESPMNLELSTFPDVAPSTLFGERWVKDILDRRGLKKRVTGAKPADDSNAESGLDSGISVNGVFGETEQWLWTANRGLRKLRAVLEEKWPGAFVG